MLVARIVPLPYSTTNKVDQMLKLKRAERITQSAGESSVTLREIEEELASFCHISRDGVVSLKRGNSQPSLSLAMKVCKFFDKPIEAVFTLEDEPNA